MKKYIISLACVMALGSSASAVSVAGFEVSPEVGIAYGSSSFKASNSSSDITKGDFNKTNFGGYARIWLGAFDFVVAPQAKFDYYKEDSGFIGNKDKALANTQYGASAGYNIGLVVANLTPYVGINHSKFNHTFEPTIAYNAGAKLKIDLIPISFGVHYTFQEPKLKAAESTKTTMHNVQFTLGLHF